MTLTSAELSALGEKAKEVTWRAVRDDSGGEAGLWTVRDAMNEIVFFGMDEERARLIASAPAVIATALKQQEEIERLRTEHQQNARDLAEVIDAIKDNKSVAPEIFDLAISCLARSRAALTSQGPSQ